MAISNGAHDNGQHDAADQLRGRLNEPQTAEALNRLLDHADLLAFSVSSLDGFVRRGEEIADNVAASVADLKRTLPPSDLPDSAQIGRLLKQLPRLLELTNQIADLSASPEFQATLTMLSKPETLGALNRLLAHTELLAFLVGALEAFVSRGEQLTDNIRSSVRDVSASIPGDVNTIGLIETFSRFLPYLPRLVSVAPKFIEIIEHLEPFVASPEFDALLRSGVFNTNTVGLVGRAGDAFVESFEDNRRTDRRVGMVGLLRALNDPDVQRAAGLVAEFGKRFGKTLDR